MADTKMKYHYLFLLFIIIISCGKSAKKDQQADSSEAGENTDSVLN
jgi:hypothetical protein